MLELIIYMFFNIIMWLFTKKSNEKELFYDRIEFLRINKYFHNKIVNKEKIEAFELLYKNYNSKNKKLINNVLKKDINYYKEQLSNSSEDNLDTYYYKDDINYLNKIKEILSFNKKDFNNYKKYLNDYGIIVDLKINYDNIDFININKQDELHLLKQNKDYLKKLFNDVIEDKNITYTILEIDGRRISRIKMHKETPFVDADEVSKETTQEETPEESEKE